jgi:hypothetical protein
MRPISRWHHMMSSYVTVQPLTGKDVYQQPTYGTGIVYKAHLSRRQQIVKNAKGEEVMSNQALYVGTAAAIESNWRVTLSTGDVGSTEAYAITPPIVAVERRFDESGPHHIVVYFGHAKDAPSV